MSPLVRGASPDMGTSPHLHIPARGAGSVLLPVLFLFPSSFFCPTWLRGDLVYPFRCPRSSASVQQVLCENCSICRCIPDVYVQRDELPVLLLLCHLGKPRNQTFIISHLININSVFREQIKTVDSRTGSLHSPTNTSKIHLCEGEARTTTLQPVEQK